MAHKKYSTIFDTLVPWLRSTCSKAIITLLGAATLAQATDKPEADDKPSTQAAKRIEVITIIAKRQHLAGAATTLNQADLEQFSITNIHKLLSSVPGINFRSEEGYGLRPNLGIRGTPNERSGRITIMEDGILIAPAPYAAPSAYYFPTIGRMAGVEIIKGSAALTEGPYTIGGALNLLSTPIPDEQGLDVNIRQEVGENNMARTKMTVGFSTALGFSGLIEIHRQATQGFDAIADSSNNTGFKIKDYLGKLRWVHISGRFTHQFNLKYALSDQLSKQTYVGLTEADFNINPHRRYGLTALDQFDSNHRSLSMNYSLATDNLQFRAIGFDNQFERNWFKVHDLSLDANLLITNYAKTTISSAIARANSGDARAIGVLSADQDALIRLKNNARQYGSRGLEMELDWTLPGHDIRIGYRRLKDKEDRLQNYEFSRQENGQQGQLIGATVPRGGDNRLTTGQGTSLFGQDVISFASLLIKIGVRHERYQLDEQRYNPTRTRATRTLSSSKQLTRNTVTLFGGGVTWLATPSLQVFLGLHQGFAPTRSNDSSVEKANNLELGLSYQNNSTHIEAALFNSDYSNIVGECRNANQGAFSSCATGTEFNGGAALIRGLEFTSQYDIRLASGVHMPLSVTYSYTDATFATTFNHKAYWGEVKAGDAIPYLPKHQLALSMGLEWDGWQVDLQRLSYSNTCSIAACSAFTRIDSWHNYDIRMTKTLLSSSLTLYSAIHNLTNRTNIVSRSPNNGARAQKPRTWLVGVSVGFQP